MFSDTQGDAGFAASYNNHMGNPRLDEYRNTDTGKATAARVAKSQAYKSEMLEVINEMEADFGGYLTAKEIANRLNEAGYQTPRGCAWSHTQVLRVRPITTAVCHQHN